MLFETPPVNGTRKKFVRTRNIISKKKRMNTYDGKFCMRNLMRERKKLPSARRFLRRYFVGLRSAGYRVRGVVEWWTGRGEGEKRGRASP